MTPFSHPAHRTGRADSRIQLSDKTSRLHPRHVVPKPAQAYEPKVPVKMREWIGPALATPGFVLELQPPAQPHRCVAVECPIRLACESAPNVGADATLTRRLIRHAVGAKQT